MFEILYASVIKLNLKLCLHLYGYEINHVFLTIHPENGTNQNENPKDIYSRK